MDWSYLLARTFYNILRQEAKGTPQKYYVEAIQKFKSTRNLHETTFVHDLHKNENTQDISPSSNEDYEFQDCQEKSLSRFRTTYE